MSMYSTYYYLNERVMIIWFDQFCISPFSYATFLTSLSLFFLIAFDLGDNTVFGSSQDMLATQVNLGYDSHIDGVDTGILNVFIGGSTFQTLVGWWKLSGWKATASCNRLYRFVHCQPLPSVVALKGYVWRKFSSHWMSIVNQIFFSTNGVISITIITDNYADLKLNLDISSFFIFFGFFVCVIASWQTFLGG